MFLWDMNNLVEELKTERISKWKSRFFIFLSPFIHISSLIIFSTLIISHRLVEYSFKDYLTTFDTNMTFYNNWAWTVIGATLLAWFIGVAWCYTINQKTDRKKFWQRLSILGFSVNFHITVYACIVLGTLGIFSYLGIMNKISIFMHSIWPETDRITAVTCKRDVISNIFRTTGSVMFLPFVPNKIELFLKNLREVILWAYPIISLLPPLLTMLHYILVARLLQKFSPQQPIIDQSK